MPPFLIPALGSLVSGVSKLFGGGSQKKLNMRDVNALGTYQPNELAEQQLALANNLYNSRMAGAAQAENNIYASQANTADVVGRAATDPNAILALAGAAQGQTNNALAQLSATEAEDRMRRAGMVMDAQKLVISEEQNAFNDKLRQLQQKIGVRGVAAQNTQTGIDNIASSATMFGNMFNFGKNK